MINEKIFLVGLPGSGKTTFAKQLAEELNLPATGVAVAISNNMVPRDEWETTKILEGADIVIVKAFCGG